MLRAAHRCVIEEIKTSLHITSYGDIICLMIYQVSIKRKVDRGLNKLPKNVQQLLFLLIEDLKSDGPVQKEWSNFSPLGKGRYHCHLTYRHVACWTCDKGQIEIEVYYAGSREKAPY